MLWLHFPLQEYQNFNREKNKTKKKRVYTDCSINGPNSLGRDNAVKYRIKTIMEPQGVALNKLAWFYRKVCNIRGCQASATSILWPDVHNFERTTTFNKTVATYMSLFSLLTCSKGSHGSSPDDILAFHSGIPVAMEACCV